jgi:diphthine-ammonia ligase
MKVVAAWSGGKDSCFAYYKALRAGMEIVSLITFMQSDKVSSFHGIGADLLNAQAQSIRVPLVKRVTTPQLYEKCFKETLLSFKNQGVEGLVTGDIYEVAMHEKGWLERVCREVGYNPIRPLWQGNTKEIFEDFIDSGFKATVVRTKLSILGKQWLGRELDQNFLADILKLNGVDPCGEGGEYHTIVTDGPIFNDRIRLINLQKTSRDEYGRLEIKKFDIKPKTKQVE